MISPAPPCTVPEKPWTNRETGLNTSLDAQVPSKNDFLRFELRLVDRSN